MSQKTDNLYQCLLAWLSKSASQRFVKHSLSHDSDANHSDRGFALPLALGMGLIMLLVGMNMIARSQNGSVTASAQKTTARGLGAAETGITRYQALINNSRVIATYKDCEGTRDSDGVCPDSGTTLSWSNPSTIQGIENPCTADSEIDDVQNHAVISWQYVDPTNSETKKDKGQFRLVSYVYPAPGTVGSVGVAPGMGQLTVEGRVGQVDNDDGLASSDVGTGTTRLQVDIPVVNLNSPVAGLMIQNVSQRMDNNEVDGNIVIPGCTVPIGVSDDNLHDPDTQDVIPDPYLSFPATPSLPTSNLNSISASVMNSRIWGQTLPKTGDMAQPDGSYHYLIQGNLSKNGGANINLQSGAKIVFYVQGNISLGGNPVINQNGYPQNMQIYGNNYTSTNTTKYGCAAGLTLNTNCPTLSVNADGSSAIQALIHAPDATGYVTGSGGGCDTSTNPPSGGGFIGAVWIKKWDRQSNNAGPMVCAYGNYDDYLSTEPMTRSSITSIKSWQRQVTTP